MRLFTAISLPDKVRKELTGIQPDHPHIHLTPASQLHLTLRFIGETDKAHARRIEMALDHVRFRSFDLVLIGSGAFPSPKHPSVLWIGVRYQPILRELFDAVQEELGRCGIPPGSRGFHPHVTLGRIRTNRRQSRKGKNPVTEIQPIENALDSFFNGEPSGFQTGFHVNSFQLYHSRLHSGGAIHHCLREYQAD